MKKIIPFTALVIFMLSLFSCAREVTNTTGWSYNSHGNASMKRYRTSGKTAKMAFRTITCPSFGYTASRQKKSAIAHGEIEGVVDRRTIPKTDSTATNPENGVVISENPFELAKKDHTSTFSIDVDRASYSNVRRMINQGTMPSANDIRLEEMVNYFVYDYPQPVDEHPFSINMETAACPWTPNHQLVLVGLQGKKLPETQLPPSNLVFLLDVSGSMNTYNKLPLVKKSLNLFIGQLRKSDRISIVVYAGAAGLVLPSTPGNMKDTIMNAINELEAGGSTAGGQGIKLAYKIASENLMPNGNNRVILCTDGDFNVGVSSDTELQTLIEGERNKGIYLSVLGYGMGNYQDTKLEMLADKGNGNYAYIDSEEEAKKVFVKEFDGTLFTIAKDVKIQVDFNPDVVKTYRLLGYENRILQDWEFDDDTRDAGEIGSGHTVTAIYEIELYDPLNPTPTTDPVTNKKGSIMTFKFRYKPIDQEKSILVVKELDYTNQAFENASNNLQFASAVAAFGMVLRESKYKGTADLNMVLSLAQNSKGMDKEGYRTEFIELVKSSKLLGTASK